MSKFEFLSIAVSIVFALALGKLISAAPHVFNAKKFDWIHALLYLFSFLGCILQWWSIWILSAHADWSLGDFLLMMAPVVSFYLAIHMLISENPPNVLDWRSHLAGVQRWFFAAILAATIFTRLQEYFLFDMTPVFPVHYIYSVALLLGIFVTHRIVIATISMLGLGTLSFLIWIRW